MDITQTLLERSYDLVKNATSLDEVSYIVKSLSDTKQLNSTILGAVNEKFNELSANASAKDVAHFTKSFETYLQETDSKIYSIGIPGTIGFGVATCPPDLLPEGWTPMDGHDRIGSKNYGSYIDQNGSELCFVPKHYVKLSGNNVYISDNPRSDYIIQRCFINGGKEIRGIFIYKYLASNKNGVFASVKNAVPLSTYSGNNPISALNNAPANNMGGLYKAVQSAGVGYHLMSVFEWQMLFFLSKAHAQEATSEVACAYVGVNPKYPKGCHASILRDANDSSVTYSPSGYSDCGLTGSGVPFAKTTHNGQECGIADLNGLMWECASGFIRTDDDGFLVLKESVDIRTIVDDSTDGGAYDASLYDQIDISDVVDGNDGWIYFGNDDEIVFNMNTDRTSDDYKRMSIGVPNANGVSSNGTTEFGNDGLYRYLRNEMACRRGGSWGYWSDAGVLAMDLSGYRTHSSYTTGGRACYLV